MATTIRAAAPPLPTSSWHEIELRDVAWATYRQLRDAPANDQVRMVYLDGALILMSPELKHDRPAELLGLLVRGVAAGRGVTVMGVRSTTLRRAAGPGPRKGAGKEADATFYLGANERRMRRRDDLDLDADPAPDLAIEVENSRRVTAMTMKVFARLQIPEVWRYRAADRSITIHRLDAGSHVAADRSGALPCLTPALICEALARLEIGDLDENAWFEWIKAWAAGLPEPEGMA